jgi:hypothetical protein
MKNPRVPPAPGPRRTLTCPYCGGHDLARIVYGLVVPDEKLNEALRRKKVVLGGCCVTDHDPAWQCNSCAATFGLSGHPTPPEEEEDA